MRKTGDLVGFLAHIFAIDDVVEFHRATNLGQDGRSEGIPLDELITWLDGLTFALAQMGTVGQCA